MHYRVNTTRISDWNYSKEAWYYVTICTKNNVVLFGEVGNENVYLNPLGKFCDAAWRNIPSHYKSVTLDKYVVMPNHLHGIVAIKRKYFLIRKDDIIISRLTILPQQNTYFMRGFLLYG